jgi:predicted transcriptional regulator
MTGLPLFFTESSHDPYDRHKYKIVATSGESVVVDDYMVAQATWFQKNAFLSHIVILDKKTKKQKKGF